MVAYGYIYGWLKVAFGIFCLGKTCCWHLLTGAMFGLLQRNILNYTSYREVNVVFRD